MRFVDYKIDHNEEHIEADHENNTKDYAFNKAFELGKIRVLTFPHKKNYPAFIKRNFALNPGDFLAFIAADNQGTILVWDD